MKTPPHLRDRRGRGAQRLARLPCGLDEVLGSRLVALNGDQQAGVEDHR
ncbi:MAG: hypothetical protein OXH86_10010 [Acidimicrobiaceae bacterium]|nr:hypothetical protein [Acidimicrobiaceae bacterium]MDE0497677.1 hypothetical protein [Acidimicrobiaceae bacterium]